MIDTLISLLVLLIVCGLLYWAVMKVIAAFGIPAPIATLIQVVFVVIVVLAILSMFFGGYGWHSGGHSLNVR